MIDIMTDPEQRVERGNNGRISLMSDVAIPLATLSDIAGSSSAQILPLQETEVDENADCVTNFSLALTVFFNDLLDVSTHGRPAGSSSGVKVGITSILR